jgi:hypothetical protein
LTDERDNRRNATKPPKEGHRKAERPFFWGELDQRLVSPKRNDLFEEMRERIAAAEHKIELIRHGNYWSRWFALQEPLINELAGRLYAAYCDAWREQKRSVSPSFIRAIRDRPIAYIFARQKSAVRDRAVRRARQRGESLDPATLKNWDLSIDRLANRWWHKLEAKAVASEYRIAAELSNTRNTVQLKPRGRPPRSDQGFVGLAGQLWRDALPLGRPRVSKEMLLRIASQLDEKRYKPPSKYLEGKAGRSLKEFNRHNANAKLGSIKTWSQLVQSDDKDYVQGMRRLLSRCAGNASVRFVRN